jgi:hypothetical protein
VSRHQIYVVVRGIRVQGAYSRMDEAVNSLGEVELTPCPVPEFGYNGINEDRHIRIRRTTLHGLWGERYQLLEAVATEAARAMNEEFRENISFVEMRRLLDALQELL